MKKLLPILLGVTLLLNSCIKDDMDACAGYMHIYFSYIYGGANRFFETVSTPTQLVMKRSFLGTPHLAMARPTLSSFL